MLSKERVIWGDSVGSFLIWGGICTSEVLTYLILRKSVGSNGVAGTLTRWVRGYVTVY